MAEQKPTVGRIVHYYSTEADIKDGEPIAALIVSTFGEGIVALTLFLPNGLAWEEAPFSEAPRPGHWSWPPRV